MNTNICNILYLEECAPFTGVRTLKYIICSQIRKCLMEKGEDIDGNMFPVKLVKHAAPRET